jgi:penicillin-binding protein 1A
MVLGAMETTLLRLTNAYAVIANGGHKVTPSLIDKIQDRNGKLIYSNDQRPCINCVAGMEEDPYIKDNRPFVTDPRSAYQLTEILEGVIQHTKTSAATRTLKTTIAGKTGTTNDTKDTWFIGFTPDLVVGVFVGFDEPRSLGKHESGAMVAQPIFNDIMKEALVNEIDKPFKMPAGIKLVKVDYNTGEPSRETTGTIYEAFKVENFEDPEQIIRAKIEVDPEPKNIEKREPEQFNFDEIQDDGIY